MNVNDVFRTNIVEIEVTQSNGNNNLVQQDGYRQNIGASIVLQFRKQKSVKIRDIENASDDIKNRTR